MAVSRTYLDYEGLVELVSKLKAYTDDKVTNFDLFYIVPELPTSGMVGNRIYLVPVTDEEWQENGNKYAEYAWVADDASDPDGAHHWEKLGEITVDTSIANFYTKTEIDAKEQAILDRLTTDEEKEQQDKDDIEKEIEDLEEELDKGYVHQIGTVTISKPLNLTFSIDTTKGALNVTGSIDAASADNIGYMTAEQYVYMQHLIEDDPFYYASRITEAQIDSLFD